MEEVKRQFGQHIAVEPEWEAGFSLQIQLRHILAMFQDWCSSDVSCHTICPSNNYPTNRGSITINTPSLTLHALRIGWGVNCCGQLLLVCPFRTRSCSLHLKSATKPWCSAITSPSIGRPLTTTCASTSFMFVHTKFLRSLSAYICQSPGYWLVGEPIFQTPIDLLVFFCYCQFTPLYIVIPRPVCTSVQDRGSWTSGWFCKWHEKKSMI